MVFISWRLPDDPGGITCMVYLTAWEYGSPQNMLGDSVHIVSKLSLIKSRVF